MATLEQIANALKAADAAGNVEDAKRLAAAYRQAQGGGITPLTNGKVTPQGSTGELSRNVQGLDAEGSYDFALNRVTERYFPGASSEGRAQLAKEYYAPYDLGKLFNAGLTFGFNDEAAGAGQALGAAMMRGANIGEAYNDFAELERARQKLGAEQAGGLGVAAEIGGAILGGRPDMAAGKVAGLVPAMVEGAKGGAVSGGVYGFGSSDGDLRERVHDAAGSALFGAGVGAAVPAVVAGGKKIISPMSIPAAKQRAASVLEKEGVELTAGQRSGSEGLRFRESELGGKAAADFVDRQTKQFTAAALKRIGVAADEATPDVIEAAGQGIGQQFEDLAARNGLQTDPQFVDDLNRAWQDFESVTNASQRPPYIQRLLGDISDKLQTGYAFLDGNWFKATRSDLARKARTTSNPEFKEALQDILSAFDEAMDRSLQQVNPADLGAWREARRLYKNLLVIEDAATRAGTQAADGVITPQALRSAAIRVGGKRGFARGWNEFTDLANAGVSTMTPLPNSGTAGRLGAKSFVPLGAGTGATIGGLVGGYPGAAVGFGVGAAVPWAAGRAILSRAGRRYLTNQAATGPTGGQAAVIGALMARGSQPLLERLQ